MFFEVGRLHVLGPGACSENNNQKSAEIMKNFRNVVNSKFMDFCRDTFEMF